MYFYEAFVVVLSASLLGMLTGSAIGMIVALQQSSFTNEDLIFSFPWHQFWLIMGLSLIFAFFATLGPAIQLSKKEISQVFRMNQ